MKTLNALTVRKKFGSVIDEVWRDKVRIVISRANKPLVVMIPFDDYEKMMGNKDRERRLRRASSELMSWSKKYASQLSKLDAVKAVRETREER